MLAEFLGGVALITLVTFGVWMGEASTVDGAAPWWPPAGIIFAYLVVAGPRGFFVALLARYIGIWIVFFDGDASFLPLQTMIRSAVIVAAFTLVAVGYRSWADHRQQRARLAFFLLLGVMVGPALAAMGAEVVDAINDQPGFDVSFERVRRFWVGDAIAVASIAPFMMAAGYWLNSGEIRLPNRERLMRPDALLEVAAMILSPVIVFWIGSEGNVEPRLALTVLPILWVAARHRPTAALAGLLVLNATIAYVASRNLASASDLLQLQSIMLAAAVAALVLGSEVLVREGEMQQLESSEAKYRRLVDGSPDAIVGFDLDGNLPKRSDVELSEDAELIEQIAATWRSLPVEQRRRTDVVEHEWVFDSDAGPRWLRTRFAKETEPAPSVLSITTDMTAVRLAEIDLAQAKRNDPVTGLPSRDELADALTRANDGLAHGPGVLAVIHIGLDNFETMCRINSTGAGDTILQEVSKQILEQTPQSCCLARVGGDQFAIGGLFPDVDAVEELATRIVELGSTALPKGEFNGALTISAGLATTGAVRANQSELFRSAEVALNAAKESGGGRYVECDPQLLQDANSRREILDGLRQAVGTDEILLHFQPEMDLVANEVVGYEALLRWNHPTRGLLLASEFIAVAEESRLIDNMTHQLIDGAVAQLGELFKIGGQDLFMGINLAPTQLDDKDLATFVASCCEAHEVEPDRLRIEVTENTAMSNTGNTSTVLRQLRDLGASVAIDDFGTGYASIGYLHQLPVNVIKIDRRFVTKIESDETDRALVSMVVALARGLHLSVVAEGIETAEQRAALVSLGCLQGQGYGLGRPASGTQVLASYAAGPNHISS